MHAYNNRMKFVKTCSVPRRRWINACRRVIVQNTVKALTKRVSKMKFKTMVGGQSFTADGFLDMAPVDVGMPNMNTNSNVSSRSSKKVSLVPLMGGLVESAEDPSSATPTPRSRAGSPNVGGITSNSSGMLAANNGSNMHNSNSAGLLNVRNSKSSKATMVSKSSSLLPAINK